MRKGSERREYSAYYNQTPWQAPSPPCHTLPPTAALFNAPSNLQVLLATPGLKRVWFAPLEANEIPHREGNLF